MAWGADRAEARARLDRALADTVILVRHFEAHGRMRKAISILEKRSGLHGDTIRELVLKPFGITLGAPLVDLRGVLTGTPVYEGNSEILERGAARAEP